MDSACTTVTQQKAPCAGGQVGTTRGLVKLLGLISVSTELNDDRKMKQAKESLQGQSPSLFL